MTTVEELPEDALRVLVVDDEPAAADTLAELLRIAGHAAVPAHGGRDALAALERVRPEALLVDLDMPDVDGWAVAREARRLLEDAVVLIAVTGWGGESVAISEPLAMFDHCLRKPVSPVELWRILRPTRPMGPPDGSWPDAA